MTLRSAAGRLWQTFGPTSDGALVLRMTAADSGASVSLKLDAEERAWLRRELERADV